MLRAGRLLRPALLGLLVAVLGWPAFAQKDTGSMVGTVQDPSGAVVTNAQVQVRDVDRGSVSDTKTNANGEYVASPLKLGRYTVTVTHPGFKKAVSQPVTIDVQQRNAFKIVGSHDGGKMLGDQGLGFVIAPSLKALYQSGEIAVGGDDLGIAHA